MTKNSKGNCRQQDTVHAGQDPSLEEQSEKVSLNVNATKTSFCVGSKQGQDVMIARKQIEEVASSGTSECSG